MSNSLLLSPKSLFSDCFPTCVPDGSVNSWLPILEIWRCPRCRPFNQSSRVLLLTHSMCSVGVQSLSCVWLSVIPQTVAHQAPPSIEFPRQEYWSGLPLPSPGGLPDPGMEPWSPALQADSLPSEPEKLLFSLCCLCSVAQSCLTLCNSVDSSPPGSSVHGGSPGKTTGELLPSSRGSLPPRDQTQVSHTAGRFYLLSH